MPCSVVCRLCPYISMNWLIRQWYNGRSSSITESILIWIYSNLYRGNFFALFSLSVDRFTHIKCTPAKCRPLIASINLYGCDKCFPPIHVRIYINAYSELREEEEEEEKNQWLQSPQVDLSSLKTISREQRRVYAEVENWFEMYWMLSFGITEILLTHCVCKHSSFLYHLYIDKIPYHAKNPKIDVNYHATFLKVIKELLD